MFDCWSSLDNFRITLPLLAKRRKALLVAAFHHAVYGAQISCRTAVEAVEQAAATDIHLL